jgi:restriction system protein
MIKADTSGDRPANCETQVVHIGVPILWLVECKCWSARVSKAEVMAFRAIVADVGADRGWLMAENGFQSGAVEAATFSKVHLSSMVGLRSIVAGALAASRLSNLRRRIEDLRCSLLGDR